MHYRDYNAGQPRETWQITVTDNTTPPGIHPEPKTITRPSGYLADLIDQLRHTNTQIQTTEHEDGCLETAAIQTGTTTVTYTSTQP